MKKEVYLCKRCRSKEVYQLIWRNPNTQEINYDLPTLGLIDWCKKCNDTTEIVPATHVKKSFVDQSI